MAGDRATLPTHGARKLPSIDVEAYSLELQDDGGFAGDKANKGAFLQILDELREVLRKEGNDPLGDKPTEEIPRKKLGTVLAKGDPEQAALIQSAIEEFAQQLKMVTTRFLKLKSWRDTECIAVGGGFRDSRVGELAIARANILLKTDEVAVDLQLLKGNPDEAALIGAAHLLPAWMLEGHDAILAADIGGTNIRAGLVELNLKKSPDLAKAKCRELQHWCHRDEKDIKRDAAIERLGEMFDASIKRASELELRLAPVIGIGCPGIIREDGTIERGTQNLPGNWESSAFHLPAEIRKRVPRIGTHESAVILHNDAVIQGLSQLPYMQHLKRWGIFTIGTGLGNACFAARDASDS